MIKTIVQYWDSEALPEEISVLTESWIVNNPTYEYQRFNMEQALEFMKDNFDAKLYHTLFDIRFAAMFSDIFRVAYVLKHGGLYVDCAIRCHKPIDEVLGSEPELMLMKKWNGIVPNGFIYAARPGNEFLKKIWTIIEHNLLHRKEGNLWELTGPGVFKQVLDAPEASSFTIEYCHQKEVETVLQLVHNLKHKGAAHWSRMQKLETLFFDAFTYKPKYKNINKIKHKKIVVHIGQHKTGSTAIQRFLANQINTSNDRLLYPDTGRQFAGHHAMSPILSGTDIKKLDQLFDDFYDEVSKHSADIVVISSEFFSASNELEFHKQQMNRLWKRLHQLIEPFKEKEIVCYVREQSAAIESRINQAIKSRIGLKTINLNMFLKNPTLDFALFSEALRLKFPECQVVIHNFDRDALAEQDVCIDFMQHVCPELVAIARSHKSQSNVSVDSLELMSFYWHINKSGLPVEEKMRYKRVCESLVNKGFLKLGESHEKLVILSQKDLENIHKYFRKFNSEFGMEFGSKSMRGDDVEFVQRVLSPMQLVMLLLQFVSDLGQQELAEMKPLLNCLRNVR